MRTFSQLTRRKFLAHTVAATATACAWKPLWSAAGAAPVAGRALSLNGAWRVAKAGDLLWLPATVPGCIHTDLLAAGKIPDPFHRDNEKELQWIGEADWTYRRRFEVPAEILKHDRVRLHCDGLDTLAVVSVNGQKVGAADNMFRTWEFDVKSLLQPGENVIEIAFASPLPLMKARHAARPLYEWIGPHETPGRAWVRKEPCNFGWDWGPVFITCGIWRDIGIVAFNTARLDDVLILQNHLDKGRVELHVEISAEQVGDAPLRAAVAVRQSNRKVAETEVPLQSGKGRAVLPVTNPKLWWPAGMGGQPLYEVEVQLLGAGGKLLDRTRKRIGLRILKVLTPEGDQPLRLEVNGVPFFSKGANWIPADAFPNRVTPEILRRYVADAVAVNMNTLRFWGGGYYEEDALYDACDELGVCVWADFKFGCSSYPAFDEAFMENVRIEARENLRRLRHHACIALWCGNNEIGLMTKDEWSDKSMGRADYDKLFKNLLAQQVQELAPQANYVSGSPDCGDTHNWQVWHGNKPFDYYRQLTGFMSEFGFQSFPEPKTVRAYTNESDRASVVTPVMKWHERNSDGQGCEKMRDTMLRYFQPPKDFDATLWLSQIQQALAIKIGAEYWRQTMPKSMGCVFWQYNDCWPVASWSSVDYFGRWKALHYLARRFYAPVLVSGLENAANGTIDVFVTSDRIEDVRSKLQWNATDAEGKPLDGGSLTVEIPARQSRKVTTLDLGKLCQQRGANNILTWLKLDVGGETVSDNLVLFTAPKDIKLADPQIKPAVQKTRDGFLVTLLATKPALWAWVSLDEADARYSDNFVHLAPSVPQKILVHPSRPISEREFARQLRVQSLFHTYA